MWLCVQAYDIQVADTKLTQNITQTFSQLVNSTIDWGANITFVNLPAELNQRSGAQYTIASDGTLDAFNPFLGPWFNGTVSLNNGSSSPSSDVIQAICNATSTDLDVWIKYIALSVTNALRVFTPASNDMYNGTGYQTGSSSTLAVDHSTGSIGRILIHHSDRHNHQDRREPCAGVEGKSAGSITSGRGSGYPTKC